MDTYLPYVIIAIWLLLFVIAPVFIIRFGGWITIAYSFVVAPVFSLASVMFASNSPYILFGWPHPFYEVNASEPPSQFIWDHVWLWTQLDPWGFIVNTSILLIILMISMVVVDRWIADSI
jgi:hypothetical protein